MTGVPLAIRCEGIDKHYPHFQVENVDLSVEQGSVMGLVGPNGAGKSTILRIIMGLIPADNGRVEILGHDMQYDQVKAKYNTGFVSEDMRLYENETIAYHMDFIKSIYSSWDNTYARSLLKRFDLNEHQKVNGLSHGQRVKATLLLALSRRPKLLIFDEPTTGLDPSVRKAVLDEMMSAMEDESHSILFSSHNTFDVERVSDYITFLYGGRILESSDKETYFDNWRRLRLTNGNGQKFPELKNIREVQQSGQLVSVVVTDFDESIPKIFAEAGLDLEAIERLTLEEIFLSNVQHAKRSVA